MGGVEYDDLLRGARNYACNPADLTTETEVEGIKGMLMAQLEQTVQDLETQSDRTIAKMYIGKTYMQRKRRPGGFRTFDPDDHKTWKKNGISSRWGDHKKKDYGRDGLVVLGAITRQTVINTCGGQCRVHQEDFTLAMEQKLLHHYLLSHRDPRVVNETFATGKTTRRSIAYAVYMAFSYKEETSPSTMYQYSEPGPSHTPPPLSPTNSPSPRKKGKRSVQQTHPSMDSLVRRAISSRSNRQHATGQEAGIQQASPTMNQDPAPGTPPRPVAHSRARRPYQRRQRQNEPLQALEANSNHMQSDTQQETRQPLQAPPQTRSLTRRVRFEVQQDTELNRRDLMQRYLEDGSTEIDPNGVLDDA